MLFEKRRFDSSLLKLPAFNEFSLARKSIRLRLHGGMALLEPGRLNFRRVFIYEQDCLREISILA